MVAEKKIKEVENLAKLLDSSSVIAVVNVENLPASSLQQMRTKLRKTVNIRMAKKSLISLAIAKSKKENIAKLNDNLVGMPALLFTNDNPFLLFKTLKKNKSPAMAKAGQIAPSDIVVKAGPTPFAPGPIISELSSVGLAAGVEQGKVAIKADKVLVKEGEIIEEKVANILAKLGITPMEIGLDLVAAYEKGDIFDKKILDIDETVYINNITQAARWALNLAIEAAVPSKDTVNILLSKAFREAKAVAIEGGVYSKDTINELLAKANAQASALNALNK